MPGGGGNKVHPAGAGHHPQCIVCSSRHLQPWPHYTEIPQSPNYGARLRALCHARTVRSWHGPPSPHQKRHERREIGVTERVEKRIMREKVKKIITFEHENIKFLGTTCLTKTT